MRRGAMLGLVLIGGCASTAAPYTGATMAQARWAGQLAWCYDYERAPGPRDPRVFDQCRAAAEQARAEDAAERDQIQAQRQEIEDQDARERRRDFAAAMFANSQRAYAPVATSPAQTSTSCTSRTVGSTIYTDCR